MPPAPDNGHDVGRGTKMRPRGADRSVLAAEAGELFRQQRGAVSREEMARVLGVSSGTLGSLELGLRNPTLAYLEAVAGKYGFRLGLVVLADDGSPA